MLNPRRGIQRRRTESSLNPSTHSLSEERESKINYLFFRSSAVEGRDGGIEETNVNGMTQISKILGRHIDRREETRIKQTLELWSGWSGEMNQRPNPSRGERKIEKGENSVEEEGCEE